MAAAAFGARRTYRRGASRALRRTLGARAPVRSEGPGALASWLGPTAEAHDFRTRVGEIEVKTTQAAQRTHRITRLEQLEPSPGQSLYILSLQFAGAGAGEGWTLQTQIAELREMLHREPEAERRFSDLLTLARWADDDAAMYVRRWRLRSTPMLVPVDVRCPRLTRPVVASALGALSARIEEVNYRVNLEGLGVADGTELFLSLLPARSESR